MDASAAAPSSVPPGFGSYSPPERSYSAGGDLLGTERPVVSRQADDPGDPDGPGILLDENKDLLVINDPGSLKRLLASNACPSDADPQMAPASGQALSGEPDEAESSPTELDSDVLARASDWIDW